MDIIELILLIVVWDKSNISNPPVPFCNSRDNVTLSFIAVRLLLMLLTFLKYDFWDKVCLLVVLYYSREIKVVMPMDLKPRRLMDCNSFDYS